MSEWVHNKDVRKFIASAGFICVIILLLMYLTFIPVPSGNKDIIVSIIGMFVGGIGVALNSLLGRNDDEINDLKSQVMEFKVKYDVLKSAYDDMQERLVANLNLSLKAERK